MILSFRILIHKRIYNRNLYCLKSQKSFTKNTL